ncbi:MAG: YfhO family protein [Planctomycetes bacterium]|nr:YfhO family protein [Planctomycetota bacterium]
MALLLAALCSVLFLQGALLPGTALVPYPPEQIDVFRAQAEARGELDLHDLRRGNTSGGDKYLQSLCWDRVLHDRLRAGETPRWTRDIGGGAPFVPQMAQVYEPINLLLLLLPGEQWYGWWYLLHQVLFGWFAYVFLRRIGCGQEGALVGVVTAVLGLWTQCKLHHNVILTAALSLWPMLTAVQALVGERVTGAARARWIGWLALWTGLSWLSGFAVVSLQVSYLTVGFAALLALRPLPEAPPRRERLRALLPVGFGLALGGLLSCAHMLPVLLASAVSARDTSYNPAFLAANGLEWNHTLAALWPDLLSWSADVFYPDPQHAMRDVTRMPWSQIVLLHDPLHPITKGPFQSWVETSFAIGTAPLALALLAFGERRTRAIALFFAAAALLALGFANADQPFLGLARFVPGLAAADLRRLLFVVAMGLVVLSALGTDRLLAGGRRWPALLLLGGAAAMSIVALVWLGNHEGEASFVRGNAELYVACQERTPPVTVEQAIAFIDANKEPGQWADNRAHLLTTAWRALLAIAAAGFVLFAPWRRARIAVLLGATIAELLHAGWGFGVTVPQSRVVSPPSVAVPALTAVEPSGVRARFQRLVAPDDHRAGACYPPNLPGAQGLEDAAGYNPLPPARYEQFFTALEPGVTFGGAGVGAFRDPASLSHPLADLYGIRFVLTDQAVPTSDTLLERTPPDVGRFRLLERTTVLPRATFVREVDVLPDREARLAALARRDRDVAHRVVLEDENAPRPAAGDAAPATVEVTRHRDESVAITVHNTADGYLRLADPYDAGWTATVDGAATTVYVADHYLRAVYLPAGDHEVVFRYDAARVVWPERLSLLALLPTLLLLAGLQLPRLARSRR